MDLIVVAPFIKRAALQRILAGARDVPLLCVTRWRVDELACGVSDLDVYLDLAARGASRMLLVKDLHAKYFRFDKDVIAGSCNVTGAALGFGSPSNLEVVVTLASNEHTAAFEARLLAHGVHVSQAMYEAMKLAVKAVPSILSPSSASGLLDPDTAYAGNERHLEAEEWVHWVPSCRVPGSLYDAYVGRIDDLTLATREAALSDLRYLAPPAGLTPDQFDAYVAGTLLSSPMVDRLAEFSRVPRRFGEMKDRLQRMFPAASPKHDWQTVMRWLLHFAPDRFNMRVVNYSEIFSARW